MEAIIILVSITFAIKTMGDFQNYKRDKLRDRKFYSQHCDGKEHHKRESYAGCHYRCDEPYYGTRMFYEKKKTNLDVKFEKVLKGVKQ